MISKGASKGYRPIRTSLRSVARKNAVQFDLRTDLAERRDGESGGRSEHREKKKGFVSLSRWILAGYIDLNFKSHIVLLNCGERSEIAYEING